MYISALNKGYDHKLYFLNIPAPVFNESYSIELNQQISNVIRRFNNYLAKALMKSNNFLIDIYKETSEDTGFSNSKYHIDSVHLGSGIIKSIQKQLFLGNSGLNLVEVFNEQSAIDNPTAVTGYISKDTVGRLISIQKKVSISIWISWIITFYWKAQAHLHYYV